MSIVSRLGASLLEKTICDERSNIIDAEENIHAGAHANQNINFHRPNLNVERFQLIIVRQKSTSRKTNDHKFGIFFFFLEFAKNEGRSDPCPNTLIRSGLMTIIIFLFFKKRKIFKNFIVDARLYGKAKTKLKQTAILNSSFYNIFISKCASHGH